MALSQDQEQAEHELRVEQMQTNIEKMRADMRAESRKFMLQIVATIAVSVAAGAAIATYIDHRAPADGVKYQGKP